MAITTQTSEPLVSKAQLLAKISLSLTICSFIITAFLSFFVYYVPSILLLPPPFKGWTVTLLGISLWLAGLVCAIVALSHKRTRLSVAALVVSLITPALIVAAALILFLVALSQPNAITW